MKDLNLLLTITRRTEKKAFFRFFEKHCRSPIYALPAEGAAASHTLSLFGLERTEKIIFLTVVSGNRADDLIKGLRRELYIDLPDRGVTLACPLSSVGGSAALAALAPGEINEREDTEMKTEQELIVVIANRDAADLVVNAAREGGAAGGTLLHAKGTASKGDETFFGVSITEERELLLIVTRGENRNDIIRSIMKNAGPNTPAGALAFSLPITRATGFASLSPTEE